MSHSCDSPLPPWKTSATPVSWCIMQNEIHNSIIFNWHCNEKKKKTICVWDYETDPWKLVSHWNEINYVFNFGHKLKVLFGFHSCSDKQVLTKVSTFYTCLLPSILLIRIDAIFCDNSHLNCHDLLLFSHLQWFGKRKKKRHNFWYI